MSKQISLRRVGLLLTSVAVILLGTGLLIAAPSAPSARLDCFTGPDGTTCFALSLRPPAAAAAAAAAAAGPRDVVVLFETSATQVGQYRSKASAALQATLAGLGPEDRVQLVACDMDAFPMSRGFVAPRSPEMEAAIRKLDTRTPLGVTDMEKALTVATDSFGADSKNPRALVYIGRGPARGTLFTLDRFEAVTKRLVDARVPVTSYGVGPRVEWQVLGALAAQTGGLVVEDKERLPGEKEKLPGEQLAAAVRGTVLWPAAVTWPAAMSEIFPKNPPPLRTDRESIVVGSYKGEGPLEVQWQVVGPGGAQNLAWTVAPGKSEKQNSYLPQLVERARADGGVTLPLLDASSLNAVRDAVNVGALNLTEMARQALEANSLDTAEKLVEEALKLNPNDKQAKQIRADVAARRAGGPRPTAGALLRGGVTPGAGPATEPLFLGPVAPPGAGNGGVVADFERDRKIITQIIKTEVQNAVNQARSQMGTEPEAASQNLKLSLDRVKQAPELEPEVRNTLVDVIQAALREAARRTTEEEVRRQQRQESAAAARERMLVNDSLQRKQQKLKQLMDRFDSLMDEGRYKLAEEAVAQEAQRLDPGNPVPVGATLYSRTRGYYELAMETRIARQRGFVDTLHTVEKAHVAVPDDPPIVYPDAQVWNDLTARRREKYSSMDVAKRGPAEKRILDALKSPTQLEFIETPLSDVIDYLRDFHGIEIQIDKRALDDVGIGTDTPVSKNLKGISLKSALRLMLRELDLTYMIKDEVLLITTPERAESELTVKVYPVADLVIPIKDAGFAGGFGGMGGMGGFGSGMGGGMGGQFGGMGGGMGGGAFGGGMGGRGMGGGMGGMGGGMGGNFFNVPQGILPRVPPGGFQAFSVNDDLSLPPKSTPATATAPAPAPVDKTAAKTVGKTTIAAPPAPKADAQAKIQLEIPAGADAAEVWEKYFATHEATEAAVRDAVRRLMGHRQYDHVVALIQAALRHGQHQAWMYEALVIAMQAADRPKDEIERAVMSAAAFAQNPLDLMCLGVYLSRLGFDQRALKVFQEVAMLAPNQPEPYVFGLRTAQRLNDLEGIKWATLGIVGQAWPREQADIWKLGLFTARATLEQLRAEKRNKEADAYQKGLDEAVHRDCVVIVRWIGDADVDMMIEEPSGTVCSLRNPRSTGGGILVGDQAAAFGGSKDDGHCQVYVCTRGFDGAYRVLLRRVWGKVTTGKVSVDVLTHYRGEKPTQVGKKVALDKDEALVVFDLKDGRRTEPLKEHQVANAAAAQVAISRQVLAQQLAAAVDPQAMGNLAASRRGFSTVGDTSLTPFVVGQVPFVNGGAVGYQPVIITLPEGANLAATAVVSADRRYVRITCVPLFSGVAEVHVFSMSSGDMGTMNSGTGGQGFGGLFGNQGGGNQGGVGGGVGGGGNPVPMF